MTELRIDLYPSAEIRVLLRVRNLSLRDLARKAGVGYHTVQKIISAPYYRNGLGLRCRDSFHVREAISDALQLPYKFVWGPDARHILKGIIAKEIGELLLQEYLEQAVRRLIPRKKTRAKSRV